MKKNQNYEKFTCEYDKEHIAIITNVENNYRIDICGKDNCFKLWAVPFKTNVVNKENYSIIEFLMHESNKSKVHNEKGEYRKKLRLLCAYINHKKNDNTIHKLISDREQLIKEDSDILNYWICK